MHMGPRRQSKSIESVAVKLDFPAALPPHSSSNPWLVNFNVRPFSVTVRTT